MSPVRERGRNVAGDMSQRGLVNSWPPGGRRGPEDPGAGGPPGPAPEGSGNVTSLEIVKKLVEHGANINARMTKLASGHVPMLSQPRAVAAVIIDAANKAGTSAATSSVGNR